MTDEPKKKKAPLSPVSIGRTDIVRNLWRITVPDSYTPEDLADRDIWSHLASRFLPFDKLEVISETGSWYGEYLVADTDRRTPDERGTWAKVVPLFPVVNLTQEATDLPVPDGYSIKFQGPKLRWCVIRKSDSTRIKEGFADEFSATKYANELVKKAA